MSAASPWLPWRTRFSEDPVQIFVVPPGHAPAGKDEDGTQRMNVNQTIVGSVKGRRRVNMMLTDAQRAAVSEARGWDYGGQVPMEDPGLYAPIMHTHQLFGKSEDEVFEGMVKVTRWGHENAIVNERFRNYFRFVYSQRHRRIVLQLTLDVSHDPNLQEAVNNLVNSDVPKFSESETSMRDSVMSKRNMTPGDLPFVTFDVTSLGILQALPISYWKAHHTGMQPSTKLGKDIPIVEPVAVWNRHAAVVPVCSVNVGENGYFLQGETMSTLSWLPRPELTFTAAHVAALTECGHLFTHELDTTDHSRQQGSAEVPGESINPQFTESGPYINFGFVDGDHRNATLDNVIFGVHSKKWCMTQSEKFRNAHAADLDSRGLRLGERPGDSAPRFSFADSSGVDTPPSSDLDPASKEAMWNTLTGKNSSSSGAPVRKSLWSRLAEEEDESDKKDIRHGDGMVVQEGIGAFGVTMQQREYRPEDQLFSSESSVPTHAEMMVGKTQRAKPPPDAYANISVESLIPPDKPSFSMGSFGNAAQFSAPSSSSTAEFGPKLFK